ncbi:MAG: electron transfer flavoprotein subunit alpha/FixB family protein [Bacteroidota bacterium]
MSVLLFAEHTAGEFKKAVLEAATYGYDLAQKMGTELHAVVVGSADADKLAVLGQYGVSKVHHVSSDRLDSFINRAYASAISKLAKELDTKVVVFAQTYDGRAVSPRVAVKLKAAPISGAISLIDPSNQNDTTRFSYSGKGIEEIQTNREKLVITVKTNGYGVAENAVSCEVAAFDVSLNENEFDQVVKDIVKASEGISLTEAENVVSAGRGMKGPENWGMIEELAKLLSAATACSKPTADMGWRPHHEHVGQTGIQIAPNLYIAIGISGAIQHLAGVSSSKTIVVINKDPEAPFFKIADYGIVGDLFEVVPQMIEAVKSVKVTG